MIKLKCTFRLDCNDKQVCLCYYDERGALVIVTRKSGHALDCSQYYLWQHTTVIKYVQHKEQIDADIKYLTSLYSDYNLVINTRISRNDNLTT